MSGMFLTRGPPMQCSHTSRSVAFSKQLSSAMMAGSRVSGMVGTVGVVDAEGGAITGIGVS
jgi:hypothetical protein